MTFNGTLIAESLRPDAVVDVALTVATIRRVAVSGTVAGQPTTWTFIDFACPAAHADRLAEQLAAALADGAWYTDYADDARTYIVFAGRVFSYPRGDAAARAEAVAYGRTVGVPEAQLDWPA